LGDGADGADCHTGAAFDAGIETVFLSGAVMSLLMAIVLFSLLGKVDVAA